MKLKPFLLLQLALLGSLALPASAQLFWNTNASHAWDANRWGTSSSGPYNTAWVPGSAVTFQTSGTAITAATTNVGNMQVNTNVTVTAVADTILTLNNSRIQGNGHLFFGTQVLTGTATRGSGSGILTLSGVNTFSAFTIDSNTAGGRVTTWNVSALGSGTVTVNGYLDMRSNLTIGGLTGTTGTIGYHSGTGTTLLTVGTGDATASFGGVIQNGTGTRSFAKTGSGTQTLSSTNTYTGTTSVNAGTLVVNGGLTGTSGVTVASGATLQGIGTINTSALVTVNGTLSPGNSAGTLSLGSLAFSSTATFDYEFGLSASDMVDVGGSLGLGGSILSLTDLATGSLGIGDSLTLFAYDGLWDTTTFDGLADDSNFTSTGYEWRIDYNSSTPGSLNGGSANNYVTLTVVPEPRAALLGGLATLVLLRRRR